MNFQVLRYLVIFLALFSLLKTDDESFKKVFELKKYDSKVIDKKGEINIGEDISEVLYNPKYLSGVPEIYFNFKILKKNYCLYNQLEGGYFLVLSNRTFVGYEILLIAILILFLLILFLALLIKTVNHLQRTV